MKSMDSKTREKMILWLSLYPDSSHPLDTNRFYDFVREACIHEDKIEEKDLSETLREAQPSWIDDKIKEFAYEKSRLIDHLIHFYNFCAERGTAGQTEKYIITHSKEEFMDEMGELDFHEIYELAQAIQGNTESLNFFSVSEDGHGIRTIVYLVCEIAYSFKKENASDFEQWLEKNYLDGLDAEAWYGFQNALERHKDD